MGLPLGQGGGGGGRGGGGVWYTFKKNMVIQIHEKCTAMKVLMFVTMVKSTPPPLV